MLRLVWDEEKGRGQPRLDLRADCHQEVVINKVRDGARREILKHQDGERRNRLRDMSVTLHGHSTPADLLPTCRRTSGLAGTRGQVGTDAVMEMKEAED